MPVFWGHCNILSKFMLMNWNFLVKCVCQNVRTEKDKTWEHFEWSFYVISTLCLSTLFFKGRFGIFLPLPLTRVVISPFSIVYVAPETADSTVFSLSKILTFKIFYVVKFYRDLSRLHITILCNLQSLPSIIQFN